MSKITRKEVKHVAKLAGLGLTEKEMGKFKKQLSAILEYIDILNEADTGGVEPTSQTTGLKNVIQDDKVDNTRCLSTDEALSNAPEEESSHFRVKKIL